MLVSNIMLKLAKYLDSYRTKHNYRTTLRIRKENEKSK
jgi:hypothetical protein